MPGIGQGALTGSGGMHCPRPPVVVPPCVLEPVVGPSVVPGSVDAAVAVSVVELPDSAELPLLVDSVVVVAGPVIVALLDDVPGVEPDVDGSSVSELLVSVVAGSEKQPANIKAARTTRDLIARGYQRNPERAGSSPRDLETGSNLTRGIRGRGLLGRIRSRFAQSPLVPLTDLSILASPAPM